RQVDSQVKLQVDIRDQVDAGSAADVEDAGKIDRVAGRLCEQRCEVDVQLLRHIEVLREAELGLEAFAVQRQHHRARREPELRVDRAGNLLERLRRMVDQLLEFVAELLGGIQQIP